MREKLILLFIILSLILIGCKNNKNQQITEAENLITFTKLYGYVKYFHPSDEASIIDWDAFAVFGSKKIKNIKSQKDLKKTLEELFLPIAPTVQIYDNNFKPLALKTPKDTIGFKLVAWQHQGVWLNDPKDTYLSIRTNRQNNLDSRSNEYGTIEQSIVARKYRGKKIKLSAYICTDLKDIGNEGHLFLRVDRKNEQIGFYEAMHDNPIFSRKWQKYEITGEVTKDATKISFGCFLKGNGRIWADNFQLFFYDNNSWHEIPISNPSFDNENKATSNSWKFSNKNYIYKLDIEKSKDGNHSLSISNKSKVFNGKLFNTTPKIGEAINKKIGYGLFCKIPLTLYLNNGGTKIISRPQEFNNLIDSLNEIKTHKYNLENENVRVGNIVILWNVIQHFYPYFDIINTDWKLDLERALKKTLHTKNINAYYKVLKKLIAQLEDGHGKVYYKHDYAELPFAVDLLENNIVITKIDTSSKYKIGDIILEIDGIKSLEYLKDLEKYNSGSKQWKRVRALEVFGRGAIKSEVKLKIKRNSKILDFVQVRSNNFNLQKPKTAKIKLIDKNIYYVDLTKVTMGEIKNALYNLVKADGVIFDLRGYPNGNINELFSHLMTIDDTSKSWMQVPQIIYPDRENIVGWKNFNWMLKSKKPHFNGKVIFLTNAKAISYSESLLGFVENYNLGKIVGQPTAGTNGSINVLDLIGGIRVIFTGMKVIKHNGKRQHLIGIQPDIFVNQTIDDLINSRDDYIEKAIQIVKEK